LKKSPPHQATRKKKNLLTVFESHIPVHHTTVTLMRSGFTRSPREVNGRCCHVKIMKKGSLASMSFTPSKRRVASRCFTKKVMFMAVIACPHPDKSIDGKILLRRVSETKTIKKSHISSISLTAIASMGKSMTGEDHFTRTT
jgi:hypothetical protein